MSVLPFIIIGAGPAGLAAAITYGKGAVILEGNSEAGKKLLLSGSGQCNFTNNLSNADFIKACRKAGPFLKHAVYAYDSKAFRDLLTAAGCPSLVREDGKVFPVSLKAEHIRDALLKAALGKGAEIVYKVHVSSISRIENVFALKTSSGEFRCRKLLLACGGSSWPQTGSRGDGYAYAEALGHTISPIKPALAAVEIESYGAFKQCAGNTIEQTKAQFLTPNKKYRDADDLLLTHTGLSGPLILNNSHLLAKGDIIRLHLIPDAEKLLAHAIHNAGSKQILNALKSIALPQAVMEAILLTLKINPETKAIALSKQQRNLIINALQSFDFRIKRVESLATSMSTAGGVLLKEVNSSTMESRIVNGLYFAGEVLDYALPTGGFNIQATFSTGWLAGRSARV